MEREEALERLLRRLKQLDYRFVAVTPATHARVLARPSSGPAGLRDVFGWNRPFGTGELDPEVFALMERAGIVETGPAGPRSTLRVASLGQDLFLHSVFPTDQQDAVFFGPDTYRFARYLAAQLPQLTPRAILDMGAGSGAGGLAAARLAPGASVTLVDANAEALRLAAINARAAELEVVTVEARSVPGGADLVIANPPYMVDEGARTYRDGGGLLGGEVALDWVRSALAQLPPGGAMVLYTGVAFVAGASPLLQALSQLCTAQGASLAWECLDPDIFGEELDTPAYGQVERIAAIGAVIRLPA